MPVLALGRLICCLSDYARPGKFSFYPEAPGLTVTFEGVEGIFAGLDRALRYSGRKRDT